MEKLQAAIEKARERRAAIAAAAPPKAKGKLNDDGVETEADVIETTPSTWDAIAMHEVPVRTARRNRLYFQSNSLEAGYYDRLRTKVLQQCRDNGWKRIAVTSATKGCGKTTTCANLAASFTRQRDRSMILFDMDMRRPELARTLGFKAEAGFAEVLEGKARFEEAALRLSANVACSPNARANPNPALLMLQDRTPELLNEIEARYQPDLMVFDTPPILSTDDTVAMLKYVDCAIIIAAAETTTTKHVDECEKELAEQTNILGVILNKCKYFDEAQSYYY
ncbi:MAG: CpsD/CapB family tyrosine-protein kinase [Pseudomonadota bacterium]